jgi:hypothetical protein
MKSLKQITVLLLLLLVAYITSGQQCNSCTTVIGINEYSNTDASVYFNTGSDVVISGDVCINGTFNVYDVNVKFDHATVHMGQNAKINVDPYLTLEISYSTFESCDQINMWDKIYVYSTATIKAYNSFISDAKTAVELDGGGVGFPSNSTISLENTTFNKNYCSIKLSDMDHLNSYSYFRNINITCIDGNGLPDVLLAPYTNKRSLYGVTDYFTRTDHPFHWQLTTPVKVFNFVFF